MKKQQKHLLFYKGKSRKNNNKEMLRRYRKSKKGTRNASKLEALNI